MVDAKRLKTMLDMSPMPTQGGAEYASAVTELARQEPEDVPFPDDASEEAQVARKIGAGYMEITADAGGFSCGACRYVAPGPSDDEASCMHASVRAPVSATHGCCNLFWPDDGGVSFPPESASDLGGGGGGDDDRDGEDRDDGG